MYDSCTISICLNFNISLLKEGFVVSSVSMSSMTIATAKICDFIPIISTGSNIYALFKKYAYKAADKEDVTKITNSPYYTYLKKKSAKRCLLLMIPGLNIFFAIYFAVKGSKTASVPNSTSTTTATATANDTTPTPPRVSPKIEANLKKAVEPPKNDSTASQSFTPIQPLTSRPVNTSIITPPNTGIPMANVLSGNFELFLDESEMTQGSVTGFVKNTNHWFKCTATQSIDLKSFSVVFDFAKSLNRSKPSMVVQSDQVVMLPQIWFNSIANGLNHKKMGIKPAVMIPLITSMVAQKVVF